MDVTFLISGNQWFKVLDRLWSLSEWVNSYYPISFKKEFYNCFWKTHKENISDYIVFYAQNVYYWIDRRQLKIIIVRMTELINDTDKSPSN